VRHANSTNTSGGGAGVYFNGSGAAGYASSNTVQNCVIHDAAGGVYIAYGAHWSNFTVCQCAISNVNWGIAAGDISSGSSFYSPNIYSNNISALGNWDDSGDVYHHNDIYWFGVEGLVSNSMIYKNVIGPGFGAHCTGGIFYAEQVWGVMQSYDNVFVSGSDSEPAEGFEFFLMGQPCVMACFNNTYYSATQGGNGISLEGPSSSPNALLLVTNCCFDGVATYIDEEFATYVGQWINYNDYYGGSSADAFSVSGGDSAVFYSLSSWKATFGQDGSSLSSNPNINTTTFVPNAGSPLINTGANNSVAGYTTDAAGNSWSANGWGVGALVYTGNGPAPPSNPAIIVITASVRAPLGITSKPNAPLAIKLN
jgi:hypothetical protein